ncbi:MAG: signal peptidase I, partial [Candidatus Omnitrophota bacterium]
MKCQNSEFLKLSKDILEKGFSLRFQVRGASMYPFIKSGDTVEIEPKSISKINYADIILYYNCDGKIVIHRVVKKIKKNNETILTTEGDFLPPSLREFVPSEKVLGKVV